MNLSDFLKRELARMASVPTNAEIFAAVEADRAAGELPQITADEIVTAIHVPETAGRGVSSFLKLGARKYLVISIAMVAARLVLDGEEITRAALSVGSCSAVALRLPAAEAFLAGKVLNRPTIDAIPEAMLVEGLQPIEDLRSNAAYRQVAAGELLRRCLRRIAETGAGVP